MTFLNLSPTQLAAGQIALAAILAVAGFAFLLPRPKGQSVKEGIAALIASVAVFGTWLYSTFGNPMPDVIGTVLFCLFSAGALGFGTVLVVQANPARGAIAFAFVILSTCGLFLLLAAPFLMAATIIIYAGAIIVTFLFVLMLSHADGQSNENNRSREPLFGGFAGFAFTSLVLFTLYLTALGNDSAKGEQRLPAAVLSTEERATLADAIAKLESAEASPDSELTSNRNARIDEFAAIKASISTVVGVSQEEEVTTIRDGSLRLRLEKSAGKPGAGAVLYREDQQARNVLIQAAAVRTQNWRTFANLQDNFIGMKPNADAAKAEIRKLHEQVVLLYGSAELPARNVANLGYLLYTHHLLAIELAGTLLLVATIGAVAIAQRKAVAA